MRETLARKLRVLRAERDLTLREAEKVTGVTRETLSALEHGQRGAHTSTLQKIADGYGVPPSALLGEEPAPARKENAPEGEPGFPEALENPRFRLAQLLEDELGHAHLLQPLDEVYEEALSMTPAELRYALVELADEFRYLRELFLHPLHYVLGKPKDVEAAWGVSREEHDLLMGVNRAILDARKGAMRRARILHGLAVEKGQASAPSEEEQRRLRQALDEDLENLQEMVEEITLGQGSS